MLKKMMNSAKIVVLSTLGLIALSAVAQNVSLPMATDTHPLVEKFKLCVSPFGLTRDLPLAEPFPSLEAAGKLYVLGDIGAVSDGYKHSLFVSGDGKAIYIVQVGGLAGTYKVFGPLDSAMDCLNKASSS